MINKILFINPPSVKNQFIGRDNFFPLGLMSIGTVLRKKGFEVKVLDINNIFFNDDALELDDYIKSGKLDKVMEEFKPDLVGLGCIFTGIFHNLMTIAAYLKKKHDIKTVCGGIHPTMFAKEIIEKYHCMDFVVLGEGEHSTLELINALNADKSLDDIDGLAYREDDNVKLNPKKKFIKKLDELPFTDYSFVDEKQYNLNTDKWYSPLGIKINQPYTIISSRSCPNKCPFCSMWLFHGIGTRMRSADNVLKELKMLYDNGVTYFQFMDDNFTINKQRVMDICNGIIKAGMKVQWDTPNGLHIATLDEELIDKMVEAGFVKIALPIESGSEYMRNEVMRKRVSNEKIFEVFKACLKHKHLFINTFILLGMPQETKETLQETYEMLKKLPCDKLSMHFATPYPGTELYDYCVKHKLIDTKDLVEVEDFQSMGDTVHFKPHKLEKQELIDFKKKCLALIAEKRKNLTVPPNYPMRYDGPIRSNY